MEEQFTHEEIEKLRKTVLQHDQKNQVKEFDLNNPPKEPYTYQEFPRLVYHHGKREHRPVKDAKELERALKAGWSKEPFLPLDHKVPGDFTEEPEVKAAAAPQKPADPPKTEEPKK